MSYNHENFFSSGYIVNYICDQQIDKVVTGTFDSVYKIKLGWVKTLLYFNSTLHMTESKVFYFPDRLQVLKFTVVTDKSKCLLCFGYMNVTKQIIIKYRDKAVGNKNLSGHGSKKNLGLSLYIFGNLSMKQWPFCFLKLHYDFLSPRFNPVRFIIHIFIN